MRVACPSCSAEMDLAVLLTHEQARRSVARLAQVSLPFGALTLQYMALFKPASRALSIDRMVRLIDELLPDIERQAITRMGREWDAPVESWRAALRVVLSMRDAGTLRLPLTDHALLHQVLANQAGKVESTRERSIEASRRHHRPAGAANTDPRDLGDLVADAVASQAHAEAHPSAQANAQAPAPVAAAVAPGPSRAALETRARIAAFQASRASATTPPEGTTP